MNIHRNAIQSLTCPYLSRVDLCTARNVPVPKHLNDLVVEEGHEEERSEVEKEDNKQLVYFGVVIIPGIGAVGEVVCVNTKLRASPRVHDQGIWEHQKQRAQPDDHNGLLSAAGRALELKRMANGIPPVDRDEGERQHGN
ncbi:uncharacterized protein NPIL_156241 [Nephila pilipes]|uniref:Uncharacterized protein n=1 Tax=Nephila pilipes TaxID=299642 RepID=A0A8X6R052_NEPPI|nr:uncharacterized protein NPIL_156241 [Nephila pilipes]